jgi:hypothetical protein
MDKPQAPNDVSGDVLHIPPQTRLSAEEIAKARAHHKRHHPEQQRQTPGKTSTGRKKQK